MTMVIYNYGDTPSSSWEKDVKENYFDSGFPLEYCNDTCNDTDKVGGEEKYKEEEVEHEEEEKNKREEDSYEANEANNEFIKWTHFCFLLL